MHLKQITFLLMLINLGTLLGEIPYFILAFILSILFFGLLRINESIRKLLTIFLVVSIFIVQFIFFEKLLSVESAVSFLMSIAALKTWELRADRDFFNMFLIFTLTETSLFLIVPTSTIFLMGVLKLFIYFYFILRLRNYSMRSVNLRRMILLLIPSFTLAALLFISFPRFTRGFLNTGAPSIVTSGHSNSINFQELGPLTMTNNIAFKFYQHNSDIKMDAQSYWRVSVLWHYDGKNWIASNQNLKAPYQSIKNGKQSYSIELKSHNGPYLPILDSPSSLDLIPFMYTPFLDGTFLISINNKMDRNFNILSEYPNVFSNANSLMRMKGLKVNTKNLLRIKEKYLPSSLSLNDDERLEQLITSFKSKPFSYSLNPPPYSSMEDFLLNGTLGYCSHFAPGFAYLARLFNLPSRVVTGYLGNETNPYDNSIIIRESDAHAWVEVLLKERGWVRVDPTLFIVPERGRMSAADFNDQINPYFTIFNIKISKSLLRFPFINESSLLLDSINSRFNNFVFNFDKETQASLLGYFSKSKFTFSILIALVFCFFISFYFIFIKISKNQKNKKHIKKYRSFLKKMAHQGLLKKKEETAIEFAERATRSIPTQKDVIAKATQEYINFEYRKD